MVQLGDHLAIKFPTQYVSNATCSHFLLKLRIPKQAPRCNQPLPYQFQSPFPIPSNETSAPFCEVPANNFRGQHPQITPPNRDTFAPQNKTLSRDAERADRGFFRATGRHSHFQGRPDLTHILRLRKIANRTRRSRFFGTQQVASIGVPLGRRWPIRLR